MPINVLLTGATGMVGSGVLIECLGSPDVARVLVVGRRPCGRSHPKLTEIIHREFMDYSAIESSFAGIDACFFCLGTTSLGVKEPEYRLITRDYPVKMAEALLRHSPGATFVFLSGAGADQSGKSRIMWARVKGEAETGIAALPFKAAYFFRPGYIHPMKGVKASFFLYKLTTPLFPILRALFGSRLTTTEEVGRSMIAAAIKGSDKQVLESRDIVRLAREAG